MEILLDSVVLIDPFNNISKATEYLAQIRKLAAISVITRTEVLTGYDKAARILPARVLDFFPTLDITKPIADLAAELRYSEGWKLPDAMQAALAQYHGLKLATRNTRDFPVKRYDFVVVPYVL